MAPLARTRLGGGLGSAACLRLFVGLLVLNLLCEACKKVTFNVPSELEARTLIGKVNLEQCLRNFDLISSSDPDFIVLQDGSIFTTRAISLSSEKKAFTILLKNLKDFQLKKIHINLLLRLKQTHRTGETILRRTKRRWAPVPSIIEENFLGPYPHTVQQLFSDTAQRYDITYSISGHGVNEPPVGLFSVVKETGVLLVHRPIDREEYSEFKIICNAHTKDGYTPERPLVHIIKIEDQNDNPPIFNPDTVTFSIPESSRAGTIIGEMIATDADEPETKHTMLKYRIVGQDPRSPGENSIFNIDQYTGSITLATPSLDRELTDRYVIHIEVKDMNGEIGALCNTGTTIIQVEDSNDHAPMCEHGMYEAYVSENTIGAKVVDICAVDKDARGTPAWQATFKIIKGNEDGAFRIEKDQNTNIGTICIEKGLDYEKTKERRLEIVVNNEAPYAIAPNARPISTSTCVVVVRVRDVDEGPVFDPCVYILNVKECLPGGTLVGDYRARDPETGNSEGISYRILNDPCKWITINNAGEIRTTKLLDRDLPDLRTYQCNVTISATDQSGKTGTGVVVVNLLDENDNFPVILQPNFIMCNDRKPICLTAVDADIYPHTVPFHFELPDQLVPQWTLTPNDEKSVYLEPLGRIDYGDYTIPVKITDAAGKSGITEVRVRVCDCIIPSDCYPPRQGPLATPNVTLGIWAILAMVLGSLLLLLILITLCGCCGGGFCGGAPVSGTKHVCDDLANQNLIISNTEAPGEEVMDPNIIPVKTGNMVTCDQSTIKNGGQECFEMVNGHQTLESVKGGGHHTLESVKGVGHHTLDYGRGNGQSMVDTYRYNYSEWQNFTHPRLTEKVYLCGQDEEHKHSDDYIRSYNYEGRGSPAGSVGCCTDQQEEEALDFLDQLEPKFRTLAETCVKR